MSSAFATAVPDESHWLCEGCGYVLSGLPHAERCPECGKPTSESAGNLRVLPLWERPAQARFLRRLVITSAQVIFRPSRFYRSLATRGSRELSARFAQLHWAVSSALFGVAAWLHFDWTRFGSGTAIGAAVPWWTAIVLAIGCFAFLDSTTMLAARLTTWEATYRGIRLPLVVVRRGLDYHAAHYLPVAIIAAATVIAFRALLLRNPTTGADWWLNYLYIVCGEVVLCAIYLFITYWTAMRNMMYASR